MTEQPLIEIVIDGTKVKKMQGQPIRRIRYAEDDEHPLVLMLKGALEARRKVGLKMNLPAAALDGLVEALPSLRRPTISHLAEEGWLAVETVIDESVVRDIIPQLKALGAEGIIEYPLNKLVY